jgi:peptidoglycan hydrolase-like protein with peptidoglycan-binding domain
MKKFAYVGILSLVIPLVFSSQAFAYNIINSQLDLGERNADVTSLQGFFADNSSIYPEGLVTGYFGGLTMSAVKRFQAQYGFDQVGRVGPMTRDKINSLISEGGWVVSDIQGPWIYNVNKTISNTSVTLNWSTNELASAKVFYSTSPVTMNEGDINSVGFGSTSGFTATNDNLARTSQQIIINNLQPNTTYYYVVVSTDLKGNVSVWNPNTTVRTNQ